MEKEKTILLNGVVFNVKNTTPDLTEIERCLLSQKMANELYQVLNRRGK